MSIDKGVLPLLKHTNPVYGTGERVLINGFGEVTTISDPTGVIRRLLSLLDGSRSVEEIHHDLSADFPEVTPEQVTEVLEQFDAAGFLINAGVSPEGILDDYELQRWERNINFFGSYARLGDNKYEMQSRLRDCRVSLLGLGGLGSHLLLDMAALGIGNVRAVEFDRVELSNLNRQILYRESDIGRPKLERAVERVQEFNSRITIEAVERKLSSVQDVVEAISGTDVVICVADRPKVEIVSWVNEACVRTGIPLTTGGLDTQRAVYYTIVPGETGCVQCWRRQVSTTDELSHGLLTEKTERRIGGDNAAFGPLVTMTTGFLLGELARLVTGIAPPVAAGRLMELRFGDYAMREAERWTRSEDCTVCGAPVPADAVAPVG
ncbi:ThiF family adenylyltransferase [Streptomyces sp. URMC 127]|uniref:ThiF family adenylyltransferase n=1 Tax=Streptomyces sp. URMC 127 TaxID=3423402 RepID=UPI003F1CDD72